MQPGIHTPEYWIESFKPSRADLDALYEFMIEVNQPVGIEVLAEQVVRRRVEATLASRLKHRKASGTVYRPADRYDVGQKLVFPALDGASGVVTAVRAGKPTAYFINIGRGMTTKLDDLAAAIEQGTIAGCGLDVFEVEPLPAEHLLKDLDLDDSVPLETRALALELSLQADSRFRNVGAVEAPLWALTAPV